MHRVEFMTVLTGTDTELSARCTRCSWTKVIDNRDEGRAAHAEAHIDLVAASR
jgi:hypothetical protein